MTNTTSAYSLLRFAALAALAVSFVGCAASPVSDPGAWTANRQTGPVVTPFWSEFPPSALGLNVIPQQVLPARTPVRFLGNRFGFAEVQFPDLERGWVPRGTLDR